MNVRILQLVEGAKAARGLTVIIDVFRAFSLEAYLFDMGAARIYPVGRTEDAYAMKRENPEFILAGERHGAILPGFDTGNAPSELYTLDVLGKTVVHTTSAGTQGVYNARNADRVLVCSLVNARATAEYIRNSGAEEVSLVCMGLEGAAETEEDTLCARYIRSILLGESIDMTAELEVVKNTSGAKFFDPSQSSVFPEKDFYMCTEVDKFDFVMKLKKENGTEYVEKIK